MTTPTNSNRTARRVTVPVPPERESRPGLDVIHLPDPGGDELSVTVRPLRGETPAQTFTRLVEVLETHEAQPVQLTVFATVEAMPPDGAASLGVPPETPLTWVTGHPCMEGSVAGIHVQAVRGVRVDTLWMGNSPVGCVYRCDELTWCHVGGLLPEDTSLSSPEQARQVFERLEATLAQAGMDLSHVVRTWLYLDNILRWYGDFNTVRTQFFQERNVFSGLVPASTGIAGKNPAGAALVAQALAVRHAAEAPVAGALPSPLQCPALAYGSSFSRAVELTLPHSRRVLVSGTASIEQSGKTAHVRDVAGQVDFTMQVLGALLNSRGLSFEHTTRAYAYFKRATDAPVFADYCRAHDLSLPVIVSRSDVCREDLLFELELDAAGR